MTAQNARDRWMTIQNTDWQRRKTKGDVDDKFKTQTDKGERQMLQTLPKAQLVKSLSAQTTLSHIWELCEQLWKLLPAVSSFGSIYQLSKTLTAFTSWPQLWQFYFVGVKQRSDGQGKKIMGPDENTTNTKYLRENGGQHCKATKIRKWKWLFPQRERGSYKILIVTPSLSLIPNDWTFVG